MCITFFHVPDPSSSSPFKLVLAMNRDEFFSRPTKPACWNGNLFGGWDCQEGREGGTWLACNDQGRIAFLTNIYTGGSINKDAKGRGNLVVDYLQGEESADDYLKRVNQEKSIYNPFNLVLLEPGKDGYTVWRIGRGLPGHTEDYGPSHDDTIGTFGVSNHPIDSPYKKSEQGVTTLSEIVKSRSTVEDIFQDLGELLLNKNENWPDPQIIKQSAVNGVPGPFQSFSSLLSSIYVDISSKGYGTRTHTMILVDNEWNLHYRELTRDGDDWKLTNERFGIKH